MERCNAESNGGFVCTLPKGHGGNHIDRGVGPDVTWDQRSTRRSS